MLYSFSPFRFIFTTILTHLNSILPPYRNDLQCKSIVWFLHDRNIGLKVEHSHSKNVGLICFNECPLKMFFYFILKAAFVLKIFKRLSLFFGACRKRQLMLISKFRISSTEKQIITIHILSDISRSKRNQTMESCKLIEHNVRNIIPQKS